MKKIYILIREKKGKSPEERFDEMCSGPVSVIRVDRSTILYIIMIMFASLQSRVSNISLIEIDFTIKHLCFKLHLH